MTFDKSYELITRRVDVQDGHIIKDRLEKGLPVRGFWGTAPTGKPHIGYLLACVKLMEFVSANVETVVFYADTYAFLINHDVSHERVACRSRYYQFLIPAILDSLKIPRSKIEYVTESENFTFNPAYIKKEQQIWALASRDEIRECGNDIDATTTFSPMLCPIRQALDEAFLNVHFQLGGEDQRGMFNFANKFLPQVGIDHAAHLINPLLPGLNGAKMSSSKGASTKIEFLDTAEAVTQKIMDSQFDKDNLDNNGLLSLIEMIIIPLIQIRTPTGSPWKFSCEMVDEGKREYGTYEEVLLDYKKGKLDVSSIKTAVAATLNQILEPIRQAYAASEEWQEVATLAYPEQ